jgi:hypothetical protein
MTNDHPITPPPELVQQWSVASPIQSNDENWAYELFIAHRAAQWGADQELEACCEWLEQKGFAFVDEVRAARRPKSPSLKEQALEAARIELDPKGKNGSLILRALEALPD